MGPAKRRGYGLGLLPPTVRLAVVFSLSVLFIFVNTIPLAAALFVLGLLLFLANEDRNWKLAATAPFSGLMMLLYNAVLSPAEYGGVHWLFFTVNQAGIERGLVTGLRLIGVMLSSFAWLLSTPIPEIYQGIAWLKPAEEWALGLLRGIQILKGEFVALTQSLIIRGLKWDSILANVRNLVPLATMIIPRIIENSQKATLAGQSHKHAEPTGTGSVVAQKVWARYSSDLPDVVRDVNLTVEPGEFVYVAGKNAAGKTTLLRVLGGVISWIMGEFRGRVVVSDMVTHETALADLCGAVRFVAPDPFASIHGLTVGQEISFLAKDEHSAREALATMGIAELWERETTKLSGGQQVRLVLAGALACSANVLLLDSPMQELDPPGRVAFIEALGILRQQKRCTVVVADPFWPELREYTDRVIVLDEGRLVADLGPEEFLADQEWLSKCNLLPYTDNFVRPQRGEVVAEMEDVHVMLERNHILRGIDLRLHAGELVVIMGPNGSGKTTAMLTLAGAIAPAQGEVRRPGPAGFVFQNPRLQTATMTVQEELAFGPKILAWPENEIGAFVDAGLEWTGLDPLSCPLDLHPAKVRLLATAASNVRVSTLILDEPTIGLDTEGVQKVMGLVQASLHEGKAVVIITHDEQIARLASRLVVIDDGLVVFDGPPDERT
jgi:energy-coupling factor transporter ATP-binding protein EcfA2/energy-coupling factor transporter transmembrane protein EcfT